MADPAPENLNSVSPAVPGPQPAPAEGKGQWMMGLVAMGGMIGMSAVAVAVVFVLSSNAGRQAAPSMNANPVINVNAGPASGSADARRVPAGKPNAEHTRHAANRQVQALPGKLATPTAVVGKRQIVVSPIDPAPPPYGKPSDLNPKVKFLRRRHSSGPRDARAPLPNRLAAGRGKAGAVNLAQVHGVLAVPGQEPPGSKFSNTPEQALSGGRAGAGGLTLAVGQVRRTSGAIAPYGLRPLEGHEVLLADIEITNGSGEVFTLGENDVWAEEASDPDGGYYQNHYAVGENFPKKVASGQSLKFTAAIPFISAQAPSLLVVQPGGRQRIALSIQPK